MSKHRATTTGQSVPPLRNVAHALPPTFSQRVDWFAETERMRTDREKPRQPTPNFLLPAGDDVAMTFAEIAACIGVTKEMAQYIFYRGMKKLAQRRQEKQFQDMYDLVQLRESISNRRQEWRDEP